jgi:hypothetical protein
MPETFKTPGSKINLTQNNMNQTLVIGATERDELVRVRQEALKAIVEKKAKAVWSGARKSISFMGMLPMCHRDGNGPYSQQSYHNFPLRAHDEWANGPARRTASKRPRSLRNRTNQSR